MIKKVVLVRPIYEENLGLTARACANFDCKELCLVKPQCSKKSGKTKSRAMHGIKVLEKAKKFDSIKEATKDCTYTIATTAKKGKTRNNLTLEETKKRFEKSKVKIALVFGSEPSGLTNQEISQCDFVMTIPASKAYPTMNLSHAVCTILYTLFEEKKGKSFEDTKPATKKKTLALFKKNLEKLQGIDDKKHVYNSFKALLSRSRLSEKEAKAIMAFLSKTGKALEQKETPKKNDHGKQGKKKQKAKKRINQKH